MSATTFSPGGPTFSMTVPYLRTSPVHIPRRDLVLGSSDSLFLRVTVVDSDNASAPVLDLTGGIGGPSMQMVVWPDTYYRTSWDYGACHHCPPLPIWTGHGVISDAIGALDFTFPSGTMTDWPRRCGWCVQLNYDEQGAEVLMSGNLHIRRMGTSAFQLVTGGLMTDDYILIHSDTQQQVYT